MSALLVHPANPSERYGLELVEEPPPPDCQSDAPPSRSVPVLCLFDWGMLAGFAALQLAYLGVLALAARWALQRLIGA